MLRPYVLTTAALIVIGMIAIPSKMLVGQEGFSESGRDKPFEILSQARIARIDVRTPDPTRHEHGIDLRDESQ